MNRERALPDRGSEAVDWLSMALSQPCGQDVSRADVADGGERRTAELLLVHVVVRREDVPVVRASARNQQHSLMPWFPHHAVVEVHDVPGC